MIQTLIVDGRNYDERVRREKHEDRMYAAMTNLGYACRWLVDRGDVRGTVCIQTDTDGKDKRYGGEHNDLFEAIRFRDEYRRNRAKYALIYGRYVGYLDRIRELADSHEIQFTDNSKRLDDPKAAVIDQALSERVAAPKVEPVSPAKIKEYREYKEAKLAEYVRVDLTSAGGGAKCLVCHKGEQWANPFTPLSVSVTRHNGSRVRITSKHIKNKKEAYKFFLNTHWESCIRWYGL